MSQENVEIVRRAYEVNNSLGTTGSEFVDPEKVAPDFWVQLAPDVELRERTELPDAKAYRGRDDFTNAVVYGRGDFESASRKAMCSDDCRFHAKDASNPCGLSVWGAARRGAAAARAAYWSV